MGATTVYVGPMEDSGNGGLTTATIIHYGFSGRRLALAVNGAFSYLGTDGLGSASVALDGSGNVQASVLYGPYGATCYSSGTMPGSYGYTGQHADATTGLDYDNARYYDASAGQFASADTAHSRRRICGGLPERGAAPGQYPHILPASGPRLSKIAPRKRLHP